MPKPTHPASNEQRILAANESVLLQDAVKKLKAGQPLTQRQQKLVEARDKAARADNHFDTMAQAAAWLAEHLEMRKHNARLLLKQAKQQGLPGFNHGRVQMHDLLPHLRVMMKAQGAAEPDPKESLECRRLVAQCERIEFQNKTEQGRYYLAEDVHRQDEARLIGVRTVLVTRLKNQLPPRLEGKSASEIAGVMEEVIAEVLGLLRAVPGMVKLQAKEIE